MTTRLLSIGEFAAATQLSPKALRIYDDQEILPPAHIDATNGYRFYRSDQVAHGRLIRTLREMGLSLTEIATVLGSGVPEVILSRLAREQDVRHAREKRAFFGALSLIRRTASPELPNVCESIRVEGPVAVRAFDADRHGFVERFHAEADTLQRQLDADKIRPRGAFRCALIDPLTEEPGKLEVIAPIEVPARTSKNVVVRQVSASPCATLRMKDRRTHASDLGGAIDVMFDWFDRRGHQAFDSPWVEIDRADGSFMEIEWAYR